MMPMKEPAGRCNGPLYGGRFYWTAMLHQTRP